MKTQYYKVVDDKGRISIPAEARRNTGIDRNQVVRMFVIGNTMLLEKLPVSDADMAEKLNILQQQEKESREAVQCRILSALNQLDLDQLQEVINAAMEWL